MSDRLPLQELESYLWGAATILRGLVEAGDYKQYVFPLLFFKRLSDVWDEEYAVALAETGDVDYARATANDRFVIPDGAHWNDVRTVARDVGQAIRDATRAIEAANPDRLDGIFGDAPWTNKPLLPETALVQLLDHFSRHVLSLRNLPQTEMQRFSVNLLENSANMLVIDTVNMSHLLFAVDGLLELKPNDTIYDPHVVWVVFWKGQQNAVALYCLDR